MEQVLCHTSPLCLPIQPKPPRTMVDMIPSVDYINSRMHFDAADFRPCQVLFVIDMVDMIVLNYRKYTPQMAYDTCLPAVMDITAAHDVMADVLFRPPLYLRLTASRSVWVPSL